MGAAILAGVIFIAFGVLNLAAGDFVWQLARLGRQWEGEASERSALWEVRRVVGGVIAVIVGVILVITGLAA